MSQQSEVTPPVPARLRKVSHGDRARLTWARKLLLALVFAAGVGLFIWVGLLAGLSVGDRWGEPALHEDRPGIGLAPDLSGLFEWGFDLILGAVVGVGVGLLVGLVAMWASCQFLLAPLLRQGGWVVLGMFGGFAGLVVGFVVALAVVENPGPAYAVVAIGGLLGAVGGAVIGR
jgi:hypothetical protein